MAKSIHVTPKGDKWQVKTGGSPKGIKEFETQKAGIEYAKPKAQHEKAELVIHRPNGQIREKNSYGNDPKNIKG